MNDASNRTGRKSSALDDDRMEILKMVENGTITAGEASTLLDALEQADQSIIPPESPGQRSGSVSHIRILVTDDTARQPRVNVVLPVGLIDAGLGVMRKFVPNADENLGVIRNALLSGDRGPILVVNDHGERVEIIAE